MNIKNENPTKPTIFLKNKSSLDWLGMCYYLNFNFKHMSLCLCFDQANFGVSSSDDKVPSSIVY
jgi:hypothetical protein